MQLLKVRTNEREKNMYNKKILLVDDEVDILDMMEIVLKKEGFKNIIKATTGRQAVEEYRKSAPDIIVLDIMLPDFDGYEVCKQIREISIVPIIFLSAKNEEIDKLLSFALGGDDYITKPFSPKEVTYRIKAILKREQFYREQKAEWIEIGNIRISEERGCVEKNGKEIPLTAMEFKLLVFLAQNKGIVLSKSQIIENVWGIDFEGLDNTLMVHIRHLREKIEDNPTEPRYIHTIKKMGYKFAE